MIQSELRTLRYSNGDIQRVQIVRFDSFNSLRFLRPKYDPSVLQEYARIYRRFLVPACPWIFGHLVLIRGEDEYRRILLEEAQLLRGGMRFWHTLPRFTKSKAGTLYEALQRTHAVETASGRLPFVRVIPVGAEPGLLSKSEPDAALKVNASFFLLDPFDCATRYDIAGTPFGLAVENGQILLPPLYEREALFVHHSGLVRVARASLSDLSIELNGKIFHDGQNAKLYTRPERRRTPSDNGWDHVIIGREVVDVRPGGHAEIPASGFVLHTAERAASTGDSLCYHGLEDLAFAIQAGNSLVRDGKATDRFISRFFNIRRPWRVPYPPSLYPLDYQKARAARIALGADAAGKPMLLWAEGAAKIGYQKGIDSCGASLSEFAQICVEAGMHNGINLDGGGSAQILLRGERMLKISDRREDGSEQERSVPLGLIIR